MVVESLVLEVGSLLKSLEDGRRDQASQQESAAREEAGKGVGSRMFLVLGSWVACHSAYQHPWNGWAVSVPISTEGRDGLLHSRD